MMKNKLAAILVSLLLAACAAPDQRGSGGTQSLVTVDPSGRVTRARADRNQDDSMGRAVLGTLRQSDGAAFKGVSVLAWDGSVLLAGAVSKPEHRRRAEQLAGAISGVVTVFNDLVLDENPAAPAFVPDINREQRIYAGLLGHTGVTGAYVVRMVNGVVTLMGTSRSADDVATATAFVGETDGVKWIVNRVSVR